VRVKPILAFALAAVGVACSAYPLQVHDGGFAGAEAGGNRDSAASNPGACTIVLASDYDQSGVTDADCVSVGQQPECPVTDGGLKAWTQRFVQTLLMVSSSRGYVGDEN
jgi:hypothetical protein